MISVLREKLKFTRNPLGMRDNMKKRLRLYENLKFFFALFVELILKVYKFIPDAVFLPLKFA